MLLLLAFGNFRTKIKPLDECEKRVEKGDWLRDYTWILYPEIRL